MKTVVMAGRRRWMIGAAIGLSRDYLFVGGVPVTVPDEDAAVLLGLTDTHVFALADEPVGAAEVAAGEARAEAAAAWQAPGKCCDDDEEGEGEGGEAGADEPLDAVAPPAAVAPQAGLVVGKIAPRGDTRHGKR